MNTARQLPGRGDLVALSGMDGAGKSTQIQNLLDLYQARGQPPVYLWTRIGYTTGFTRVKTWLRRLSGRRLPPSGVSTQRQTYFRQGWVRYLWLTLAVLDLMRVYGLSIRRWRRQGRTVICDRYLGDMLVDVRLNFPAEHVEQWLLWRILRRLSPQPDAAVLMLITPEESMRRSQNPDKQEPFPDPLEVRVQRYDQYRQLQAAGLWTHVLDASQPREAVWAELRRALLGEVAA